MNNVYIYYLFVIAVFLFICFLILRYRKLSKKKMSLLATAGIICITLVYMLFPFSNLFVQFSSPYDAYCATQEGENVLTIEGKDSALVITTKEASSAYHSAIIPKKEDSWKLPGVFDSHTIARKSSENLILQIVHARNTNDFYVAIYSIGTEIHVFDSNDSSFQMLNTNESSRGTIYAYYAWVDSLDEKYSITVDGDRLDLEITE